MAPLALAAVDLGASSGRVMLARVGEDRLTCARSTGSPTGPYGCRHAALGRPRPVPRDPRRAAGGGPAARLRRHRLVGRRLRPAGRPRRLIGNPVHYRDGAYRRRDGAASSRARRGPLYDVAGCSSCRSTRSTSSPRRSGRRDRRTLLMIPDLLGVLADRRGRRRGDQRLDHRAARRAHRRVGAAADRAARPARAVASRRARPGEPAGQLRAEVAAETRRRRRAAGHRRSARTTRPRPSSPSPPTTTASATSPAAPGAGRRGATAPVLTADEPHGQLHQRGRRRRHHPLPAQRDGPVAAAGVAAGLAPAGTASTCASCSPRPPRRPPVAALSTPTTRSSCRPATCRRGSPRPADGPGSRRRAARPRVRCILDSLALAFAAAVRAGGASSPAGRSRSCTSSAGARGTRCCASSPRTPAAGRWSPARSRRPRWATPWSRPAPTASSPAIWPRCANASAPPRTSAPTTRGPPRHAPYCFNCRSGPSAWPSTRSATARRGPRCSPRCGHGGRNYSLFLREDGLLIGYVETDDLAAAQAAMAATAVNARWQAEMPPSSSTSKDARTRVFSSCGRSSTWRTSFPPADRGPRLCA